MYDETLSETPDMNGKRGPSSTHGHLPNADVFPLEHKLIITSVIMEEFSTLGGRPARKVVARRRRGCTAADFLSALECLREFADGASPEGGMFLAIHFDKHREPVEASGLVWSVAGGDGLRRKGQELAGALAEVETERLPKKERTRFCREVLFDALCPASSGGPRFIATGGLRDSVENALANLSGSVETSESPQPSASAPSGDQRAPVLPADAVASPTDADRPTSKPEDDVRSAGGDDVSEPGNVAERAAAKCAGDGHGHDDKAASHKAESADGGAHNDAHDDHAKGDGCQNAPSGPATPLRISSAPMKLTSPKRRRKA